MHPRSPNRAGRESAGQQRHAGRSGCGWRRSRWSTHPWAGPTHPRTGTGTARAAGRSGHTGRGRGCCRRDAGGQARRRAHQGERNHCRAECGSVGALDCHRHVEDVLSIVGFWSTAGEAVGEEVAGGTAVPAGRRTAAVAVSRWLSPWRIVAPERPIRRTGPQRSPDGAFDGAMACSSIPFCSSRCRRRSASTHSTVPRIRRSWCGGAPSRVMGVVARFCAWAVPHGRSG